MTRKKVNNVTWHTLLQCVVNGGMLQLIEYPGAAPRLRYEVCYEGHHDTTSAYYSEEEQARAHYDELKAKMSAN